MTTTLMCPQCGAASVDVDISVERNYGADADGNRGRKMYFACFEQIACGCDLEDDEKDDLLDQALEDFID